jgi:glycosyltransferase involved in cell wall biosynthesis
MNFEVQGLGSVNDACDNPNLTTQVHVADGDAVVDIDSDVLQRLEEISDDTEFEAEISELEQVRPEDPALWRVRVRRLIKRKDYEAAVVLIDGHQFAETPDEAGLLEKAELLHDAREYERSCEIFDGLIERHANSVTVIMAYAKRLLPLGQLVRAHNLLLPFADVFPEGNWRKQLVDKALSLYALLSRLEGGPIDEDQDARILAMKHMILHFRDRKLPPRESDGLGRLTLITGSLGPGGAERQLTRLAIELERARKTDGEIAGVALDRPVEVLVRSHGPEKQNDFFLDEVVAAGCELGQIDLFKPLSNKALGVEDPILLTLIDYLPSPVNYGVRRLTKHFEASGTDTASIWQDGACLFGGLAALMAGVPHVQLAMRGLPPSMRRHLYRPEYETLYRAMAEIPGVSFVSNNLSAARAYAEWLDLPVSRFGIIYNGVEPMRAVPSTDCAALWDKFVESTADAEHTIGGVFRLDTDKQPLLWIRYAARHLKRHPNTRFVVVGGGRLLPNAQELAEKLGISDRILFTGRSTRVGYWMSKMDVLVLMSRYEGLPNVLIEAQYMGVRVVTTPAGGAAECLIDGTTGYVLDCAEKPNLEFAVERAHGMALRSEDRELFKDGGVGRTFLDSHFSIPRMLEEFVTKTVEQLRAADLESEAEELRVA